MHGLVNRSIQRFLRDTYGARLWQAVAEASAVPDAGFEALLHYDDALTRAMLEAASHRLGKPVEALLEDLGAFLVTLEPLRRLLRFGGVDYADFLMSLEELPARAHMALPELEMPQIALGTATDGRLMLAVQGRVPGWGLVLAGLLRSMADDYGALALIELVARGACRDQIAVDLLDSSFASGRRFELTQPVAS